jgi:hypothetical protein
MNAAELCLLAGHDARTATLDDEVRNTIFFRGG